MLTEVMESYGLVKEFRQAGYYETVKQQQLFKDIITAISSGQLVVLSGIVGCGKTVTLRQLREVLEKKEDSRLKIAFGDKNLALQASVSPCSMICLPKRILKSSQAKKRERELRNLIKRVRSLSLFVDEAHDLHSRYPYPT